jgi:hypothetical protein
LFKTPQHANTKPTDELAKPKFVVEILLIYRFFGHDQSYDPWIPEFFFKKHTILDVRRPLISAPKMANPPSPSR